MKNKRCIFVGDSQAQASVVAHWLDQQGIKTQLLDKTNLGISIGVSFSGSDPNADGWQVWVQEDSDLETARELIANRSAEWTDKRNRFAQFGPVTTACENCGQSTTFQGELRGSIQDCPNCGAYMDVAGGEDEYEWPDFEEQD